MSNILDFIVQIFQGIWTFWTFFFAWLPGPIGVPIAIVTFIGLILGVIKLISFILDLIPFW